MSAWRVQYILYVVYNMKPLCVVDANRIPEHVEYTYTKSDTSQMRQHSAQPIHFDNVMRARLVSLLVMSAYFCVVVVSGAPCDWGGLGEHDDRRSRLKCTVYICREDFVFMAKRRQRRRWIVCSVVGRWLRSLR